MTTVEHIVELDSSQFPTPDEHVSGLLRFVDAYHCLAAYASSRAITAEPMNPPNILHVFHRCRSSRVSQFG